MNTPMIAAISPVEWPAIGTWLANHLWQSTLVAASAGLLTLTLRKNRAQVRYWLWFAASLKFLIPFSLLIGIGGHLSLPKALPQAPPAFSVVMQDVGQPFATARPAFSRHTTNRPLLMPLLFLGLWCSGCVGVVLFWALRWWRVIKLTREAVLVASGRELEAQRRLQARGAAAAEVKMVVSASALEPGVIGVFRPKLVLPAGIADRLTGAQLDAIIGHELCHVRRRDNLAAAIHMLVEAIFWFHPLVWWMGARLVDERERACDEEVVRLGSEPQVYAESILKVCQFYLESPLVCVAGVTGSNLKKRIEDIMSNRVTRNLNLARKLLLITLGAAALVAPIVIGLLNPAAGQAQDQTENNALAALQSVSIEPSKPEDNTTLMLTHRHVDGSTLTAKGRTLKQLVASAYGLKDLQVSGGPDWVSSQRYDIDAKVPVNVPVKPVLQALLADRFKLTFHRETKETGVYELVVGTNGPKLKEAPSTNDVSSDRESRLQGTMVNKLSASETTHKPAHFEMGKGHLAATATPMQGFADLLLSPLTGRIVQDKTGLKGFYDISLDWTPGDEQSLVAAVHDELGLDLNLRTAPLENLIIDSAEKPSTDQAPAPSESKSQTNVLAPPAFATVSIKPSTSDHTGWWSHSYPDGRFVARNANLKALIQTAYGVTLISIPDALTSQRYDIDASAGSPADEDQIKLMLQSLLSTTFKLASHITTKEMSVYVLEGGPQGPKLRFSETTEDKCQFTIRASGGEAHIVGKGPTRCLANIFTYLSQEKPPSLDRPVLDNTGIKGVFDFDIPVDLGVPASFFAAVRQLGLKLDAKTAPIELLVVDHAEQVAD